MTYAASWLTWGSAAERNKRLMRWRRAVSLAFAHQPRCLRVAWALDHLFNAKTGYAYPHNEQLANMTGLPVNKVQEALLTLESDGAIVRRAIVRPNGQPQRVIYAATALLPSAEGMGPPPALGVGGQPPWGGVGGHPRQVGAYNLKTPRMPKSELARARLAAELREKREASERGTGVGCPSSEATGDRKGTRLTEEAAVGMPRYAVGQLDNGDPLTATKLPWSTPRLTEAPDDDIPAFLRRKAKGARDRTPNGGGMASDQETTEEDGTWRL